MPKLIKINIGCGENKIRGFVNVDIEKSVKPDIIHDIKSGPMPFNDGVASQINCIHNLEHIELKYWSNLFKEFHRVLAPGGQLWLAYPEFEKCAKGFLENYQGRREFFRHTLYGLQRYAGDYHVTPMVTREIIQYLQQNGFDNIKHTPEPEESWNTFLIAERVEMPKTREEVVCEEIFGRN